MEIFIELKTIDTPANYKVVAENTIEDKPDPTLAAKLMERKEFGVA